MLTWLYIHIQQNGVVKPPVDVPTVPFGVVKPPVNAAGVEGFALALLCVL